MGSPRSEFDYIPRIQAFARFEAETIERCAKVADMHAEYCRGPHDDAYAEMQDMHDGALQIATAIRQLKSKNNGEPQ